MVIELNKHNNNNNNTMSGAIITEEAIAESLAQDRPTIDAAIKTYMSWVAARSLTEEEDVSLKVSNAQALQFARMLLVAINGTKISGSSSSSRSATVATQIWNGLVDSEKKPSRFLGRIALLHAWDAVKDNIVYPAEQEEQASLFVNVFGTLMKQYNSTSADGEPEEDSNAHLIWDEPGVELERRRLRRAKRAEDAKERERTDVTPTIEEIDEDEEETGEN